MQPVCGQCGAPLPASAAAANGKPQTVTDDSFARDVVEASSTRPVLVDAWAEWCGPCRMIAPVLDELAAEANGRYMIAKLNVDENPRTAAQFQIRSIPDTFDLQERKAGGSHPRRPAETSDRGATGGARLVSTVHIASAVTSIPLVHSQCKHPRRRILRAVAVQRHLHVVQVVA